ncbi:hypothetical protein FXO38_32178 [Capsicum annuum]|uniref:Flotillin-like n=1 Tax=Capsicum annuum TaxID=4072 RepID=A0A2G2ZHP7_CAPAN|nr:hypothetical protein FXO38_32178 [Capsicum annuum]KAF3621644.1 hypothetical protein FXO37_32688 [Capsicum annuum]PHT81464.1 hypothetical protein T459_14479 [Capsicum annuum]
METANQAKIDMAEASKKEEIGAKLRDRETKQNSSKIDAETFIISTKRQEEGKKEEFGIRTEVEIFENQREAEVVEVIIELENNKARWSQTG